VHARRVRLEPRLVRRGLGATIEASVSGSVSGAKSSITNSDAYQAVSNIYAQGNAYTGGYAGSVASSAISSVSSSVLANLPPQVVSAINTGEQVVANGKPVVDLMKGLMDKTATEQQAIAAMAVIVGMANPVAGAAVAAMGETTVALSEGLTSILKNAGLLDGTADGRFAISNQAYVGLRIYCSSTDCPYAMPYGPLDPQWFHIRSYIDLLNLMGNGRPPANNVPGYPRYFPSDTSRKINEPFIQLYMQSLLRSQPPSQDTWSQLLAANTWQAPGCSIPNNTDANRQGYYYALGVAPDSKQVPPFSPTQSYLCPAKVGDVDWATQRGPGDTPITIDQTRMQTQLAKMQQHAPTAFEIFFNTLLNKNLEFWANGQPFVPVRTLLSGAAIVWNATHQSGKGQCYSPPSDPIDNPFQSWDLQPNGGPQGPRDPIQEIAGYEGSTITYIVGPNGGLLDTRSQLNSDSPDLCVNLGPLLGGNAPIGGGASSAAKTAAAVVALPAVAAAGTLLYAYATGQAIDTVVKGAWRWLTR
jgi:hypothetical protein